MLQSQHPKSAGNWELELFWHLAYLAIRKYNAPDKMLCSSAKICIQTCWLLIVAKVLDQTDLILAKNQKSIQGKIQEASRNTPTKIAASKCPKNLKRNVCLEMPICYHFDFSVQLVYSRNLFSQTQYFGLFYCAASKKWQGINRSTNKKYTGCKY